MKKLSQILAVGVITLSPLVFGASANAVEGCSIVSTGPGSENICSTYENYTCTVGANNTFKIIDENNQDVASGTATVTGNGSADSVSSGSATNSSGATFTVNVTNGEACAIVAAVPATEMPQTPEAPAQTDATPVAAVTPTVSAPQGKGAASGLPNTSANSTLPVIAGLASVFGAVAVISRLAVMAYARNKS